MSRPFRPAVVLAGLVVLAVAVPAQAVLSGGDTRTASPAAQPSKKKKSKKPPRRGSRGPRGLRGRQGVPGPAGPAGAVGPQGPPATRVAFTAPASAAPSPVPLFAAGGFAAKVGCKAVTPERTRIQVLVTAPAGASAIGPVALGWANRSAFGETLYRRDFPEGVTDLDLLAAEDVVVEANHAEPVAKNRVIAANAELSLSAGAEAFELRLRALVDGSAALGTCRVQGGVIPAR